MLRRFFNRHKWSLLATVLLIVVLSFNYEQLLSVQYPDSFYIKNFPLLEQPDQITCGPTSVAMLLQHYGKDTTIQQAKEMAKTEWFSYKDQVIGMTSPDFIRVALRRFGVQAQMQRTTLPHLKYYISQSRPPVVLVRSSDKTWHYVVAIGYDEKKIYLADPAWGKVRAVSIDQFERAWNFTSDLRGSDFGKLDYWKLAVETSDVRGYTLIVPTDKP